MTPAASAASARRAAKRENVVTGTVWKKRYQRRVETPMGQTAGEKGPFALTRRNPRRSVEDVVDMTEQLGDVDGLGEISIGSRIEQPLDLSFAGVG